MNKNTVRFRCGRFSGGKKHSHEKVLANYHELFISRSTENKKYLKVTENYMYEALTKDQGEERQEFAAWKEAWSSTDQSENSPKQGNEYDCGVFTLISMSLLQNGHRLRSNSYFQNTLYHRHLGEKTSMDNMEDRPK